MCIKTALANIYLDYVNNFLTVKGMAEYYDMTEAQAVDLLRIGKEFHEDFVKNHKERA